VYAAVLGYVKPYQRPLEGKIPWTKLLQTCLICLTQLATYPLLVDLTTSVFSLLRIPLICAFRIFSRFRTAFDSRRSTQAWLQNLAPFQVFINTSVIQDKTLTIYINVGKFKLEKAPNFVTRPASNVDRRAPFGSEKKCGVHISVKCVVNQKII
jgi:hypothetical protein